MGSIKVFKRYMKLRVNYKLIPSLYWYKPNLQFNSLWYHLQSESLLPSIYCKPLLAVSWTWFSRAVSQLSKLWNIDSSKYLMNDIIFKPLLLVLLQNNLKVKCHELAHNVSRLQILFYEFFMRCRNQKYSLMTTSAVLSSGNK